MNTQTFLLAVLLGAGLLPAASAQTPTNSLVRFRFTAGTNLIREMDVELFDTEKPVTVRNFLRYVLEGRYTNLFLHRSLSQFIVQGGVAGAADPLSTNLFRGSGDYIRVAGLPAIVNEYNVGRKRSNTRGTIAMAKLENQPNSATSEWFFNLGNNSTNLDNQNGGFTVFGQVVADHDLTLDYFAALSNGHGTVDMRNYGGSSLYMNLPVNLSSNAQPAFSDLIYVEITPLFLRDLAAPQCTVVSPFAANTRVSNGLFSVRGRASDNLAIKEVLYQLNNLGTYRAASTNHGVDWTANVTLQPGPNTFTVESVDFNGRHSVPHVRSIYCVVMRPLTLMTNGEGSIFGATNGQRFEVTRSHRLTARPAPGHLFAGWFGEASGTNLTVDFVMTTSPDFSIQASFVPNPFVPVKGTYAGLFSEADAARHESAGLATMTVTERGTYTARLTGGGRVFGMSGLFADDGAATNVLRRFGTDFLQVEWALDMSGASNNLTAVLRRSDDSWTANLSAERSGFNATTNPVAHQPLRYTMNIPGHDDAATSPGGDGFGLIKINPSGVTALVGALADGTPFTQSAPLWRDGRLPLYVPLYGGRGSIHCPLRFTDTETNDVLGLLTWTRPALPLARFYPAGFTNHLALSGSAYTATNRVLSFTNGFVAFRDGNLVAGFTNNVTLGASNRVVNASTNPLALTITSGSGMFTGTVKPPGSTKVLTFKGALNQKLGLGTGFFLGTNQGGRAFFGER